MEYHIDLLVILGIGVFMCAIFLVAFFIIKKRFTNDGYFWLYLIMGLIAFELGYKTLIYSKVILQYPFLYYPGRYFNLILYPIFFIFIQSIVNKPSRLQRMIKYIIITACTLLIANDVLHWTSFDWETKVKMLGQFYLDSRPGPFNYWGNTETLIKSVLFPLLFLAPMGIIFFRFTRAKKGKSVRLVGLLATIIVLYFSYTITANAIYRALYGNTAISMIEWPVDIAFLSMVLSALCVLALSVNTGTQLFPEAKYIGSPLKSKDYDTLLLEIRHIVESRQLYLEKGVTIKTLSNLVGINSKYVSQAINDRLNISFSDFMTHYRVEEAKKQIRNRQNDVLTLEAVGTLSGFNSKSTFFSSFKKVTGETPSKFAKRTRKKV